MAAFSSTMLSRGSVAGVFAKLLKNSLRLRRRCCQKVFFSNGREIQNSYIDHWFASIVKPETFYEDHAASDPRRYFYNVDLQGRLYLEETIPKNIATSIKDTRFLDFFFRMVRPVGLKEEEILKAHDISIHEYPFVSPCGKELNFIRPACTPIVFHTIHFSEPHQLSEARLVYAGSKEQDFRISDLAISEETGRMYHKCDHLNKQQQNKGASVIAEPQYALIRSAVVVSLSDRIGPMPDGEGDSADSSGLAFFHEENDPHRIPWLPSHAEPGNWAMPFAEDAPDG